MSADFRFNTLKKYLQKAVVEGYEFITCKQYYDRKSENMVLKKKTIVFRVDVDMSCKKALVLAEIFKSLGVNATFFIRLHASEYNPFSFENYRCIKKIIELGNEIGYHSEVVDEAVIWNEDMAACLRRDIIVMENMFHVKVYGAASHGGLTGNNNLDFFKERNPRDFNLLYEAYEDSSSFNLFKESFYISDSEWTRWKCYDKGVLVAGDYRTLGDHLDDEKDLLYLLIHPDTYYDNHFYE